MRTPQPLHFVMCLLWIAASFALYAFIGNFFAPDACLDVGDSFDYLAWECSMIDNRGYIETPIYRIPGFKAMVAMMTLSILSSVVLRLTRRSTMTRKRAS